MFDFGLRLRALREQGKLSQEALGRRIGRSKSVVSSYENNLKIPPLEVLTDIAIVFHVSLDYLVGIDKAEMISVDGLSESQKEIIRALLAAFEEPGTHGLTQTQQAILLQLMQEFSKS